MPGATALIKGFKFPSTARPYGYKVSVSKASETPIKEHDSYKYNFSLLLTPTTKSVSPKQVVAALRQASKATPIVKSRWQTPYRCKIHSFKASTNGSNVLITATASSRRIYTKGTSSVGKRTSVKKTTRKTSNKKSTRSRYSSKK